MHFLHRKGAKPILDRHHLVDTLVGCQNCLGVFIGNVALRVQDLRPLTFRRVRAACVARLIVSFRP